MKLILLSSLRATHKHEESDLLLCFVDFNVETVIFTKHLIKILEIDSNLLRHLFCIIINKSELVHKHTHALTRTKKNKKVIFFFIDKNRIKTFFFLEGDEKNNVDIKTETINLGLLFEKIEVKTHWKLFFFQLYQRNYSLILTDFSKNLKTTRNMFRWF